METAGTFRLFIPTFTPAEAERIATVPNVQIRDWRRRGFLPANPGPGWNRLNPLDVARLLAIRLFADRGIGPTESKDVVDLIAVAILWKALRWRDSYSGDHKRTLEWLPADTREALAKPDPDDEIAARVQRFMANHADELGLTERGIDPGKLTFLWGHQANWLRRRVWKVLTTVDVPDDPSEQEPHYFIWWGNGEHTFTQSLDNEFWGMTSANPKLSAALVVLALPALATTFLERAARPLVHVEFNLEEQVEDPPPVKERVAHVMRGLEPALSGSVFEPSGSF